MPVLENPKHELFSTLVAKGKSQTEAAKLSGYMASHASVRGSILCKRPDISKRIIELREQYGQTASSATGIDKAWVMKGLAQTIIDAREEQQYAVVKGCYELIGKEIGMFKERLEVTQVWNGDPSVLTDEQLDNLCETLTRMFRDPAKAQEYKKRALLEEGPVIDVEAIQVPESKVEERPVNIEDEEGW